MVWSCMQRNDNTLNFIHLKYSVVCYIYRVTCFTNYVFSNKNSFSRRAGSRKCSDLVGSGQFKFEPIVIRDFLYLKTSAQTSLYPK